MASTIAEMSQALNHAFEGSTADQVVRDVQAYIEDMKGAGFIGTTETRTP